MKYWGETIKRNQNIAPERWQAKVNMLSELTNAAATVIMKTTANDGFETSFVKYTEDYPFLNGKSDDLLESFCETVYRHQEKLIRSEESELIPCQIFPIQNPDNTVYGALCIVGFKADYDTPVYKKVFEQVSKSLEPDLP